MSLKKPDIIENPELAEFADDLICMFMAEVQQNEEIRARVRVLEQRAGVAGMFSVTLYLEDVKTLLDQLAAKERENARLRDAVSHYANQDNWVGNRYRGTIHGPAIAMNALDFERALMDVAPEGSNA